MSYLIHIKNMVCNRCVEAVQEELVKLSIPYSKIDLGEVVVDVSLSNDQKVKLNEALTKRGFELLEDQNSQLIEQIKSVIIERIHHRKDPIKTNYSTHLENQIGKEYSQLSSLFSSVEGLTIERYIILQKLEKIKELLIYDELNMSQIAYQLGYSSVQHLSNQFKKNVGMTPSEFKKNTSNNRSPIDNIR